MEKLASKAKKYSFFSLPLCFISFVLLDFSFRYLYRFAGSIRFLSWQAIGFTVCWALLLTSLIGLLPRLIRRIAMLVLVIFFATLLLVHTGIFSLTGSFFSFSSLSYAEEGAAFFSWTYISIRKLFIICILISLILMIVAAIIAPKYIPGEKKWRRLRILAAVLSFVSIAGIAGIHSSFAFEEDNVWWGSTYSDNEKSIYADFTNTNSSIMLTGFYQYTFRNFCITYGIGFSGVEKWELDSYYEKRAEEISGTNSMTGAFKDKNLIMVMMESIDTWMVTEDFMPNLWKLQQESINFENNYTPLFISASTFNTEVIALTGMAPPTSNFNSRGYFKNDFPLALPNLLSDEGYRTATFHSSNPHIYNRGIIHENFGIDKYNNWSDMGMEDYQLDSEMINAYDDMVAEELFFDFIITYSGHGPYTEEMDNISSRHYKEAEKAVKSSGITSADASTMEEYIRAVSHAMETDEFIGELINRLEEDGYLENTAVVLFSDHYSKYLSDKGFINELKDVTSDNSEDLYNTPFMIYADWLKGETVEKYTSSFDIVPTLINLFGLDAGRQYYVGDDIFGENGGTVMLPSYEWFNSDYTMLEAAGLNDEYSRGIYTDWKNRIEMSMRALSINYFNNWEKS